MSIPITLISSDTLSEGVVDSLNQPGTIYTGVDLMSGELTGKRHCLLSQVLPPGFTIGFTDEYQSCFKQLCTSKN